MIEFILAFALEHRRVVIAVAVAAALVGIFEGSRLPIDAVPDVTSKQVVINVSAAGLGPEEIERHVTFPVELALTGLPRLVLTRSLSIFGLSQVTVIFEDDVDLYFARQLVAERLVTVRDELPPGARAEMGPVSTGLGELVHLKIDAPHLSLRERRSLMDWIVRPQLLTVPGLAEVNPWGGTVRQHQVLIDPDKLASFGLSFREVVDALSQSNENAGGAYIQQGTRQALVRGVGMLTSAADIGSIVVAVKADVPVTLAHVARIVEGDAVRQGACTEDGRGEEVFALALLLIGENGRVVMNEVGGRLAAIEKMLPAGTRLSGFLDRSTLIGRTVRTATTNLVEGGLLVIAVLFAFLMQLRAGLIVSSVIPLSMLVTLAGMRRMGLSANLMSLGALDFGLIVDGAVIIVENVVRRLALAHEAGGVLTESEHRRVVHEAASEVLRPSLFGVGIIVATYAPILTLTGVEGKMFRPMGLTVIMALAAAVVASLTVVPALCVGWLPVGAEPHNPLVQWLERAYRPALDWHIQRRARTMQLAIVFVLACFAAFPFLGSEFIPELDEGAVAVSCAYDPGLSLAEVIRRSTALEKALLATFPDEVERVVTRIGRPEVATDPMLTTQTDVMIALRPRGSWTRAHTKEELVARFAALFASAPELEATFTQPIKMRMMEMVEGQGMKADLGVKIFGPDLATLESLGEKAARIVAAVPGNADARLETTSGLPQLQLRIRRDRIARYGVRIADVTAVIEAAIGGKTVTRITDGASRTDVAVRLEEPYRDSPERIAAIRVPAPGGRHLPLGELAEIATVEGPVQISRERGQRRVVVLANVRGRDLGSFAEEVQRQIDANLRLPAGYWIEFGGTYERLSSGRARLAIVVPLTFLAVFLLLCTTLGSLSQAAQVFTGIPFAITGGIIALFLRTMPFSISAGVGFIALAGIAVLNGLVMITFINQLRADGLPVVEAVTTGALARLRPVLMTAAVASIGFAPMALSTGSGAEVQRPLATVVIGGLVSSTVLTLLVLPAIYVWLEKDPTDTSKIS